MRDTSSRAIRADSLLGVMIARSTPWAAAAALLCVFAYLVVDGVDAALAALLGAGFVVFFFGVDLLVLRFTRESPGAVTAAALLGEYLIKVLVLAAALWALSQSTDLDLQPMAVTVVVTTIVGAVAVTLVAMRTRSFFFDFPSSADTGSNSQHRPESPGNAGDS